MNFRQSLLPNGHTIGFDDLGSERGEPFLFFHGTPASRINFRFFDADEVIRERQLRVICPDRPGIGGSSPQADRTTADWAEDMELLLDELGLERVTLLAHSGGGPYALSCAAHIPQRVKAIGLVAGSPLDYGNEVEGTNADSERFLELCARRPAVARGLLRLMRFASFAAPDLFVRQASSILPRCDREVMEEPEMKRVFLRMVQEALRQGPAGAQQDGASMFGPWRLPLEEIGAPVLLWYGSEDRNVPPQVGEWYSEKIDDSELSLLTGEGHLSIMVRHGRSIIESLLART
ncbi:MAG TPA: alpha/beta hydrolase [Trueperaceae bacterium]